MDSEPLTPHRRPTVGAMLAVLLLMVIGCGSDQPEPADVSVPVTADHASELGDRLDELRGAVTAWAGAETLEDAHAAAETAANLVVGPNGPGFGDRDGDGSVGGDTAVGLLPGLDGTPAGLAEAAADNECVGRDVLGATIDDPAEGWGEMRAAIDAWRPDNNTMPTLASHPMRIVGWATFTLGSDSLERAHEYAGHAQLHVDVSTAALDC